MKKIFISLLTAAFVLTAVSCGKDDDPANDPNNAVPDPIGTITVYITKTNSIEIKNVDGEYIGYIGWYTPNNLNFYGYYSGTYFPIIEKYEWRYEVSICDLGAMQGLGNITSIPPSAGFTTVHVACEAGHGYVIKFQMRSNLTNLYYDDDITYVRLYVDETTVDTYGGIMGAKVKYQYPFNP
jgi:hypothetical protein